MNLIERAKNIILKPKDEWTVVEQETTSVQELVVSYLLLLALIPAIAALIRYGFIGHRFMESSLSLGIKQGVVSYISMVAGAFLSAWIINLLATGFGSTKDFRKAMQLVVYSYTPMMIAGIFNLIPGLGFLTILGLYGLYLLYIGLKPMMKTPDAQVTGYFIVSLLVILVVYFVLGMILAAMFVGGSMMQAM